MTSPFSNILLFLNHVGFVASGYVIQVGMAYLLLPNDYGTFVVALGLMTTASLFVSNGWPQVAAQYIASGRIQDRRAELMLLGYQSISIVATTASYLALCALWMWFVDAPALATLLVAATLAIPSYALSGFVLQLLVGHGNLAHYGYAGLVTSIVKPVLVLGPALLGAGAVGAIVGYAAAGIVQAGVALSFHHSIPHRAPSEANTTPLKDWKYAMSMTVISLFVHVLTVVDLVYVQNQNPEGPESGWYGAAAAIGKAIFFVGSALGVYVLSSAPRIGKDKFEASALSGWLAAMPSLLFTGGGIVAVLSNPLIGIVFPSAYAPAKGLLPVLAFGAVGLAALSTYAYLHFAVGRPAIAIKALGASLLLEVIAAPFLMARLGFAGAAWAFFVASFMGLTVVVVADLAANGPTKYLPWVRVFVGLLLFLAVTWVWGFAFGALHLALGVAVVVVCFLIVPALLGEWKSFRTVMMGAH